MSSRMHQNSTFFVHISNIFGRYHQTLRAVGSYGDLLHKPHQTKIHGNNWLIYPFTKLTNTWPFNLCGKFAMDVVPHYQSSVSCESTHCEQICWYESCLWPSVQSQKKKTRDTENMSNIQNNDDMNCFCADPVAGLGLRRWMYTRTGVQRGQLLCTSPEWLCPHWTHCLVLAMTSLVQHPLLRCPSPGYNKNS